MKFVAINIVAVVVLETFRSHVGFKLIQLISDQIEISIDERNKTEIIPDFGSN